MRVALYCRISTDEDLQKYSLRNQEAALRQYAARRDWGIAGIFRDRMSGSKSSRPGLTALLEHLADQAADAVLVTEQDRLSRLDEIPWALLKQTFRRCGAKLFTLSGEVDFGNEDHEFTADLLALIDRRRRKTIVRQMVRGRAAAAARGEWLGRPPYGYRRCAQTKHLQPHPLESAVVREIFERFAEGEEGSARIARGLGVRASGLRADFGFVLRVLRNPVYVGDLVIRVGGDRVEVRGAHPPVVDRELWLSCNRLLDDRGRRGKTRLGSSVGLSCGIVRCTGCGEPLSPTTAKKRTENGTFRYHYYRHVRNHRGAALADGKPCRAAHRVEQIDAKVRIQLRRIALSGAVAHQLASLAGEREGQRRLRASDRALRGQLSSLERREERLIELYLAGDLAKERLRAERERLEESAAAIRARREEVARSLREAEAGTSSADLVAEAFAVLSDLESLALGVQQRVARGLIERVDVDPEGEVTVVARTGLQRSGRFARSPVEAG